MATQLVAQERAATDEEHRVLARWSSWGAVPGIFDPTQQRWARHRQELADLVGETAYRAAARTTLNAHYTEPDYAAAMWQGLQQLGFTGGRVLEPGCGAGAFLATAPPDTDLVGVELDPSTAAIAAALHPGATVHAQSFADTRLPPDTFDAVVGNVPFAKVTLTDPHHNSGRHSIHNHFIIKSLALTRPGGLVAVLTSRFTLDARNDTARREIAELADLVTAIRLPTGAHSAMAGTEAVTDLLILQRRDTTRTTLPAWVRAAEWMDLPDVFVNQWFHDHPDLILGNVSIGAGMHGAATVTITPTSTNIGADLTAAITRETQRAHTEGVTWTPAPAVEVTAARLQLPPPDPQWWDGHLHHDPASSTFVAVDRGSWAAVKVPASAGKELRALLALRDTAASLVDAERRDQPTATLEDLRTDCHRAWTSYTDTYGPLNRFTESRTTTKDGESITRRVPAAVRIFTRDPGAGLVLALEDYDPGTGAATPAALLTGRVMTPTRHVEVADDATEAVAITLAEVGRIDTDRIAALLGTDPDTALRQLHGLAYRDPDTGTLVAASEYLSGDVRAKLAAAITAAHTDDTFTSNVDALRQVQPPDLAIADITPRLGATWISPEDHQGFLRDLLDDPHLVCVRVAPGHWHITGRTYTVAAAKTWGTDRLAGPDLAKALIEQRPLIVYDTTPDGGRVLNPDASAAAEDRGTAMQEAFAEWVWADPQRAMRLHATYNRMFNQLRLRDYTSEADALTLPGLATTFTPRAHQRQGVARILHQPTTGLFQAVGAGKTAVMAIAAMELRRLGLANKPVVVVPNHMLRQFTSEWLQLYPAARLLTASSDDLTPATRRRFIGRAAAGDYDGIIMSHSGFQRLPVASDTEADYRARQLDTLRTHLHAHKDNPAVRSTVKRMERKLLAADEKLKKLLATGGRDPGLTFEAIGVDYVFYDEAHACKNLATTSVIPGAAVDGSGRASDLAMKIDYLRRAGRTRIATLATATPIANSITEAHVMLRYTAPDLLATSGTEAFDDWVATFGQVTTELELSIEGGGRYRPKTRLSKFANVPEMLRMMHHVADVRTEADLNLPIPTIAPGPDGRPGPTTILVASNPALDTYIAALGDRADQVRGGGVDPAEDNLLKISTDARKAALDIRLVTPHADSAPSKIAVAADHIARIWGEHRGTLYPDAATGHPHPRPGALQLVFCDMGTPRTDGTFDAYHQLRDELTDRGLPAGAVAFIHDAATPVAKARLFAQARSGDIAVLVGSTEKMGVGTNVQHRLVALHHLDAPWRPADVSQRNGRILRQGNTNPQVHIHTYVVEGSMDAFMWQTLERKARFVDKIMRSDLDVRELDDIGDTALSYAEVKALASGDPLTLDKANADAALAKYTRLDRAHTRTRTQLQRIIDTGPTLIADLQRHQATADAVLATDPATLAVVDRTGSPVDVGVIAHTIRSAVRGRYSPATIPLGHLAGLGPDLPITVTIGPGITPTVIHLATPLPGHEAYGETSRPDDLEALTAAVDRILDRLRTRLHDVPPRIAVDLDTHRRNLAAAQATITTPFAHTDALAAARARVASIDTQIAAKSAAQDAAAVAATAAAAPTAAPHTTPPPTR